MGIGLLQWFDMSSRMTPILLHIMAIIWIDLWICLYIKMLVYFHWTKINPMNPTYQGFVFECRKVLHFISITRIAMIILCCCQEKKGTFLVMYCIEYIFLAKRKIHKGLLNRGSNPNIEFRFQFCTLTIILH